MVALFRAHRITGWRRGMTLLGKPDFVFLQAKLAVFVDGCFWHACPRCGRLPSSNAEYWAHKIDSNRPRDNRGTGDEPAFGPRHP
jgi:DNA mismatch endonuclease (patch repair protein)